MKFSTAVLVTGLFLLAQHVKAEEEIIEPTDRDVLEVTPPPEPFVCTNPRGRAAFVGRCICFLLFNDKIMLKNRGMAKRMCVAEFGPRSGIIDRKGFCQRFRIRGGGKADRAKLVKLANKFSAICDPENPIILMLNMMMKMMM